MPESSTGQYKKKYTPSRAGPIQNFPVLGQLYNLPQGEPQKSPPMNFLSTRSHKIWPRISLSAIGWNEILIIDHLGGKAFNASPSRNIHFVCEPTEPFAVS